MKRFIVISMLIVIFSTGCREHREPRVDYSEYLFVDKIWTRDGGHDIETIIFHSNGKFSYSCACGNSVNDSDLCNGYTYNNETKEIEFNCIEATDEMIQKVNIIEISEHFLKLDFDGEIREFQKNK